MAERRGTRRQTPIVRPVYLIKLKNRSLSDCANACNKWLIREKGHEKLANHTERFSTRKQGLDCKTCLKDEQLGPEVPTKGSSGSHQTKIRAGREQYIILLTI